MHWWGGGAKKAPGRGWARDVSGGKGPAIRDREAAHDAPLRSRTRPMVPGKRADEEGGGAGERGTHTWIWRHRGLDVGCDESWVACLLVARGLPAKKVDVRPSYIADVRRSVVYTSMQGFKP